MILTYIFSLQHISTGLYWKMENCFIAVFVNNISLILCIYEKKISQKVNNLDFTTTLSLEKKRQLIEKSKKSQVEMNKPWIRNNFLWRLFLRSLESRISERSLCFQNMEYSMFGVPILLLYAYRCIVRCSNGNIFEIIIVFTIK